MAIKASDYWNECIAEAFDQFSIKATEGQAEAVAIFVEGAHDVCGASDGSEHQVDPAPATEKVAEPCGHCRPCTVCRGVGSMPRLANHPNIECRGCRGTGRQL